MENQTLFSFLPKDWRCVLAPELAKPYIEELSRFIEAEYASQTIYPPRSEIFSAFLNCPYENARVVIMGQDPYHGVNQAHGLSFSVRKGVPIPPSLQNIYKELAADVAIAPSKEGYLLPWAQQGVLMLNATLTVRATQPKSHYGKGWERFTDAIVAALCQKQESVIFVLWGRSAQEKCLHIVQGEGQMRHFILSAPHPSPYSAASGFFGCRHFSQINALLKQQGKACIDWRLP